MLLTLISFIFVVGIIVFVHELGHFMAAKLSGVRVEVFSLGFPPKLWSRKVGETEYQIAWIPLGGFVKMSGMADESMDEDYDPVDPRGFNMQPYVRKLFIITAGVLMNCILGFLIYSAITWHEGVGRMTGTTLTMVSEDYPAFTAGLQVGDKVTEVAGNPVSTWDQLTKVVREHPGDPILIRWQRGDSLMSASVTPRAAAEFDVTEAQTDTVGKIGVVGTVVTEAVGPLGALRYGGEQVYLIARLNAVSLGALLSGKAHIRELTGPLGIAKMSGESARSGAVSFFAFIGMISISIAFLNILPIPMLDGGHLLFISIEAVIRREIPEKVKIYLMKAGLAALLLLVLVISYHDIIRFYLGGN
jgi:regulator of sigma E protease